MIAKDDSIFVAGHKGMVGSALLRRLRQKGYANIVTRERAQLDLLNQEAVAAFFKDTKPTHVFMAAGKTGGIYANTTYRADFLYENIVMQSNVIHQSFLHEVQKLVYFACSCIYPKHCPQPMSEEHILSGALEPTNEPFAIAKLAGLKMCEAYNRQYGTEFITVIPTNLYGPDQRYELMTSMVVPSLIHRFHQARKNREPSVCIWGSGQQRRDFLFVDDLAEASLFLMENCEGNVSLNVGSGRSWTIAELAGMIKKEIGYEGEIVFDRSKPEGVAEKLQDVSRINSLGWYPQVDLVEGIRLTYRDYVSRIESA